ncbi:MAG: hypothetical protein A2312_00050 [Candidatus Staskawiczbacteria bacterium RIFOXYB2_FULL_32_9]|uniref:Uncharacterized protein n=1 Tax=Candidatus Staskawiczbacteria bacterium RIFOXYD1_FULL_32_13 TaxID=1802234 RepID=A0A1G2JKC5_9BACT|nr:MAG: hypothetical protein UR22_C0014G0001 [Parcubacteria group bacterium GW2011_GWC2_32_10]OGZ77982.1 MAG: hypothetical protein A2360_02955 [Candidatus Staskawiczbacteria bacterium RIFOXYB1_FULL_32_11]OGZ80529.1 MAG: hypothetical protein A2256_01590 [Candidatus Staskawiczbacteria bacterium RIFOXYA2_FULL_32_7]OGZ84393.1 MAG: hypothetical protein A2312_00050 [Candidatus Staskawiczbacteria bacterium RIFOXYB2_FULL_32_9]OGZ87569.1 MAG: hypothetical protein A2561_00970 [Candidatus Staskawiczbacter
MVNLKKYFATILLLIILVVPTFVSASWWNPFSWNVWQKINSIFNKPKIVQVQQENKNNKEKGQENVEGQKERNDKLLLGDVYPLFGDLKWSPITPKKAEGVEPIGGFETKSQTKISGFSEAEKFFTYYKNKLTNLGWQDDWSFSADGVLGSQIGFKKGDDRIVLSFNLKPGKIISGVNEPLRYECPCETTYSIFTAVKKDETVD